MRNVSIWELKEVISRDTPPIVRLFRYKGVKRTLNEFLSPVYVYRDGGFFRRDKNIPNLGMTFDLSIKGQVVLMGYGSLEQSEKGQGAPLMVFGSFEQAVHWLIRNGYDFYGEESANWRRRKVKSVDFYAERKKYLDIAHQYEQSKKSVLIKPCVTVGEEVGVVDNSDLNQAIKSLNPTPPASRVLNDQGAPVKQKVKKPTFMENMMKFLRLFKK